MKHEYEVGYVNGRGRAASVTVRAVSAAAAQQNFQRDYPAVRVASIHRRALTIANGIGWVRECVY